MLFFFSLFIRNCLPPLTPLDSCPLYAMLESDTSCACAVACTQPRMSRVFVFIAAGLARLFLHAGMLTCENARMLFLSWRPYGDHHWGGVSKRWRWEKHHCPLGGAGVRGPGLAGQNWRPRYWAGHQFSLAEPAPAVCP